jgi:hypothetical protein
MLVKEYRLRTGKPAPSHIYLAQKKHTVLPEDMDFVFAEGSKRVAKRAKICHEARAAGTQPKESYGGLKWLGGLDHEGYVQGTKMLVEGYAKHYGIPLSGAAHRAFSAYGVHSEDVSVVLVGGPKKFSARVRQAWFARELGIVPPKRVARLTKEAVDTLRSLPAEERLAALVSVSNYSGFPEQHAIVFRHMRPRPGLREARQLHRRYPDVEDLRRAVTSLDDVWQITASSYLAWTPVNLVELRAAIGTVLWRAEVKSRSKT